jgi:hypothetical protein
MAVLNFIGVIAVLVLAFLVYGERKAWQYTVYRYDLAMYGLPPTEEDLDDDAYRYLDLGSKEGRTLTDLFGSNNPVNTQVKEVERIKRSLDSKVGAGDNREQMNQLATVLLPLSETNSQRETYISVQTNCRDDNAFKALRAKMEGAHGKAAAIVTADPKKSFAKEFSWALRFPGPPPSPAGLPKGVPLVMDPEPREPFEAAYIKAVQRAIQQASEAVPPQKPDFANMFDSAFNEATETVRGDLKQQYDTAFDETLKAKIPTEQRRHAIAHLLVSLDESLPKDQTLETDAFSAPAFTRIFKIIGIQELNRELHREAIQLTRISLEQDKAIERDRIAFVNTHGALIAEAHSAAQTLAQQNDEVKELEGKVATEKVLVDAREKNVADSRDELARRRKYTHDMIEIVNKMTEAIHTTRIEVRDANTLNQGYVEKIKDLESKR